MHICVDYQYEPDDHEHHALIQEMEPAKPCYVTEDDGSLVV